MSELGVLRLLIAACTLFSACLSAANPRLDVSVDLRCTVGDHATSITFDLQKRRLAMIPVGEPLLLSGKRAIRIGSDDYALTRFDVIWPNNRRLVPVEMYNDIVGPVFDLWDLHRFDDFGLAAFASPNGKAMLLKMAGEYRMKMAQAVGYWFVPSAGKCERFIRIFGPDDRDTPENPIQEQYQLAVHEGAEGTSIEFREKAGVGRIKVRLATRAFDERKHSLTTSPLAIDGLHPLGTDISDLPRNELAELELSWNGKPIPIPKALYTDCFNAYLSVGNGRTLSSGEPYLMGLLGEDGSSVLVDMFVRETSVICGYEVLWILRRNGDHSRFVRYGYYP